MSQHRLQGRTVLIVDDDEDILGSIELAIRAEGAETVTASDGNEAIGAWHRSEPDAIVLDVMLPKRSGFLVLEKLQQADNPPPVVMVTANQGKRHMAYAESLGVKAYFYKPVALQRLVDKVVEVCGGPGEAKETAADQSADSADTE